MTITTNELLDTSIAQLRTLAAFLREQLGPGADRMPSGAAQVRACKELLSSLSALILRLQAARETAADAGEPYRDDRRRASGMG
jgi:hypothetical protein